MRAERIARVEVLAGHDREGLERIEPLQLTHAPGLHDFRPVRDHHRPRGFVGAAVEVGWEEIEPLGFDAEGGVGDRAFADEQNLLAAAKGVDDRGPLFEGGMVGELHSPARNVTELTGPSQTVIAVTTAFSPATAEESSRWNHSAMFSAEGLMPAQGGTSLMQP